MIVRYGLLICLFVPSLIIAELPADLPGEEITQEYMKWALPKDTALPVADSKETITTTWYDRASKTWEAPSLTEQMSSDRTNIPLGKGAIFIPKFSEFNRAPEIEILNPNGESVMSGELGKMYSVEPGTYFVVLGSGTHKQRIVRQVDVEESKATPVLPDWSGLTIETVDSNSVSFRGEYELVRIDEFEPYGRGFGADPTAGEALTTWILKPGTYKIFGRGQSFNTLRNFVTVRLLPGEYVKFILVQRPEDYSILGGGTVNLTPGTSIKSRWRYGANIGGSLNFAGSVDNSGKTKNNTLNLNLNSRSGFWLSYNWSPFEWISDLSIDEGFNVSDLDFFSKFDFTELVNTTDNIRLTSLFIWRVLSWFGPYGRTELSTNLFPKRLKRDEEKTNGFYFLESDSVKASDRWDSVSSTAKLADPFTPFNFEVGGGANFDIFKMRLLDTKVRLGVGSSMSNIPEQYIKVPIEDIKYDSNDVDIKNHIRKSVILQKKYRTGTSEFGPQGAITTNLHIGRFATAWAELKVFTPVFPENRITRPDFDLLTTLSWRLSRAVTLDYDYSFTLKQPEILTARRDISTHSIWLRFAYSSR